MPPPTSAPRTPPAPAAPSAAANAAATGAAANATALDALVAELHDRLATAAEGGTQASRDRHVARGKLLPRDRIDRLLDDGSPFLEIAPLAADGLYDDERPAPGSSPASGWCTAATCWSSPTTRRSRAAPTTR